MIDMKIHLYLIDELRSWGILVTQLVGFLDFHLLLRFDSPHCNHLPISLFSILNLKRKKKDERVEMVNFFEDSTSVSLEKALHQYLSNLNAIVRVI